MIHTPPDQVDVIIGCEFSGTMRDAFRRRGINAWSIDLLDSDADCRWHIKGDVLDWVYRLSPLLAIYHPPCTDLANSGAAKFKQKQVSGEQAAALDFVRRLLETDVPMIALENPNGVIGTHIRPADQVVHPWQFGHPENKSTCFWLKGLPRLRGTEDVKHVMDGLTEKERNRMHWMPPSADRWAKRSKTYPGIAAAAAQQWGDALLAYKRDNL